MKRFFILIFGMICTVSVWSQADTVFVLPAEITGSTVLTDSTFQITCTHAADQLGQSYNPTNIISGYRILDASGLLFRVVTVQSADFTTSTLDVVELQNGNAPSGTGVVYRKQTYSECIPVLPMANSNLAPATLARIVNHNTVNGCSDLSGLSGGSADSTLFVTVTRLADTAAVLRTDLASVSADSAIFATVTRLADSTAAVRADFPSGGGGLTGTLTDNYIPVADATGNLEDSFLETADALAGPNTELGLGLNTTPSDYKIDVLNSSTSGAVGGLRILYSDGAVVSDEYGIVVYEGTILDGDRRFSVDAGTGDVFSDGRYFINGDNPNIPEASSTPVLIGEVGGGKPTIVGYGTNANLYAGFYDTSENKAWSYGRRRGGAGGSGFVITDSIGVAAAVPNFKIKEGGGQVGISQIDPQYLLDIGSTASIRLNPHTSTPTGALGVQWVNSGGYYLDHDGIEYLRRVLMENTAPTDGDLLTYDGANSRFNHRNPYARSYTPTATGDSNGDEGDISYDDSYIYVKTSAGWKRAALSTF